MAKEAEVTDLLVTGESFQGVAERPKALQRGDLSGTEGITADEIRLPRLTIAQGLSDQMMPDNSQYISNLRLFDLFNDLTGEVYGRGPITVVPLRRDVRRIEFVPRDQGGGIVDMDVPAGDARLKWTINEKGESVPPVATTFDEFVIMMLLPGKAPEPIVLSIKHTNKFNRRAVANFNTFIKLRNAPIYAGLYTISSVSEKNDNGTWGVPVIKNAGWIPVDTPHGKALFDHCRQFAKSLEGKDIVVDREQGDEAAIDFDTSKMA
jgi:hypothetical protein